MSAAEQVPSAGSPVLEDVRPSAIHRRAEMARAERVLAALVVRRGR